MYGFVPIAKENKLKQNYSIATPKTWTFEKDGELYAGVEDEEFSDAQKDEIESNGGQWFESAQEFIEWYGN